jgi:hypothetical protein
VGINLILISVIIIAIAINSQGFQGAAGAGREVRNENPEQNNQTLWDSGEVT